MVPVVLISFVALGVQANRTKAAGAGGGRAGGHGRGPSGAAGSGPAVPVLYLSAGVVRTMERPYGTHPFRAAGSAGGRFPLEVYVAVPQGGPLPEGGPLPAGVHWYDFGDHALVQIGPPPRSGGPTVGLSRPGQIGAGDACRGW